MFARIAGLLVLVVSVLLISSTFAQEKNAAKHDAASLHASLREVVNAGADLFNLQADYAGCYRLYQGSLIAIKPLLKPEMQSAVDKALAEAAKLPNSADRAHRLRAAIDAVREQIRPSALHIPAPPVLTPPTDKIFEGELIRVPPTKVKQ